MDSCYSGDRIVGGITTCSIEESQQKYRLGTVSNILLGVGVGGLKHFFVFWGEGGFVEEPQQKYRLGTVSNILLGGGGGGGGLNNFKGGRGRLNSRLLFLQWF